MEPITQGLLGAAVGQAACSRRRGRRALVWGAVVGMGPDLDVLVAPLHGGFGEWLYHRGTTHSLWFGPVVGPLLGWLLSRWRDPAHPERLRAWQWLCVLALFTHPLLDAFTAYGTQFFAPFWRIRFAWNGVAIVDPVYSLVLAAGVAIGARAACSPAGRRRAGAVVLALSTLYLVVGVALNAVAVADTERILARRPRPPEVRVYPTLLQPFLRRVVARDTDRTWVGLHTTLAPGCTQGDWFSEPARDGRVADLRATWEGGLLGWFAMGETSAHVEPAPGGRSWVSLEDLRYGPLGGAPDRGLWGVRALYDAAGRRVSPVVRFSRRIETRGTLEDLWHAMWGDRPPGVVLPQVACG